MSSLVRSALFVDFDNIYGNLSKEFHIRAAERFATAPLKWLKWLENYRVHGESPPNGPCRRFLLRKCYLNPIMFRSFRNDFVKAGFQVVDCPPLTGRGKNAADILMVLDILDALNHSTHFDEFIIFSQDADFTPVLLRLRAHDRRTGIFDFTQSSVAYQAACDFEFSVTDFVEQCLGVTDDEMGMLGYGALGSPSKALSLQMAKKIYEEVFTRGELLPERLPSIFLSVAPNFKDFGSWMGFGSLRRLTAYLVDLRQDIEIKDGDESWKVILTDTVRPSTTGHFSEEISATRRFVQNIVEESSSPVKMEVLAHQVRGEFIDKPALQNWFGFGKFKDLVQSFPDFPYQVINQGTSSYLLDTTRHELAIVVDCQDPFQDWEEGDADILRRISESTDIPALSTQDYQMVFNIIGQCVDSYPFIHNHITKLVRDASLEKEINISRSKINFIVKGITTMGYEYQEGEGANPPEELANYFLKNVYALCQSAELKLSDTHISILRRWILSSVEHSETEALRGGGGTVDRPDVPMSNAMAFER